MLTIKSYLPVLKLSTFVFKILILFLIWCKFALKLAVLIAFLQQSIPIAEHFFRSFKIDIIIHPEPMPISSKLKLLVKGIIFKVSSIKCSVSGLGISTFLST